METQTTYDIVLEGGGAKGMVFVGALQEFLTRGHQTGRLLGTSAGAIAAVLLAVAYTADEMGAALSEEVDGTNIINTFMGTPGGFSDAEVAGSVTVTYLREIDIPLVPEVMEQRLDAFLVNALLMHPNYRHLFSFVERGGWYSADNFLTWLARKLDSGSYQGAPRAFSGMTMGDLFDATGKHLTVVAADTTDKQMLVLNHITAPDLPVIWAVRMSMSIPFLWQEVIWQPAWGSYRGRDMGGHAVVDGGLLSSFPLELFVSDLENVTAVMGPKESGQIVGLLIDEDLDVPGAPPAAETSDVLPDVSGVRTLSRMKRILDTATQGHDKFVLDGFEHLAARMPAKGYGTTEFDMSDARREAIIAAGRDAMAAYFDRPMPGMIPLPPTQAEAARARMRRTADEAAMRILRQD